MNDEDLDPLIDRADLDGLVRLIDARCETRDWEGLFRIRERARLATETGRQVYYSNKSFQHKLNQDLLRAHIYKTIYEIKHINGK